ncbi:hypothetical protein AX15_006018 [Amanita polypyramis BW_CC]|nr:hypothetical protein AX15_006018 [Amanita polypyramis BW_CC]
MLVGVYDYGFQQLVEEKKIYKHTLRNDKECAGGNGFHRHIRRKGLLVYGTACGNLQREDGSSTHVVSAYHNLQSVSIRAMEHFRKWIEQWNISDVHVTISWCPAHMDVSENEYVDKLATPENIPDVIPFTTLNSMVSKLKTTEYDEWDTATRKYNALGHEYLRLKYKGKRIGPTLGSRRNAFVVASKDNIKILSRLTRTITNHAPTGEYRRCFIPTEPNKLSIRQ